MAVLVHLAPMVTATNVTILGTARRWQRWASALPRPRYRDGAGCHCEPTDVFNPMTMDAQLAQALEHSLARTGLIHWR